MSGVAKTWNWAGVRLGLSIADAVMISAFTTETFRQYSLLEVLVINCDFPRLSSDNRKLLEVPYIYLDVHAQSCLPTVAMSSSGQLKLANWFLPPKASEHKNVPDCMIPKWRDCSEAPLSIFITLHYKVLPSFQFATAFTWPSQSGGDLCLASEAFSQSWTPTQSYWAFRRVQGPRRLHRLWAELKA